MILGCFQSKMERFTNNQNTLQESFLNIRSQKIQHMKLKLQMLTGKHSILCSTGRWIFFSFVFNKQHMNKRTIHILELGMEKIQYGLEKSIPGTWLQGPAQSKLLLQHYEALKTSRSQKWVLRFPSMHHIHIYFYTSPRIMEALYFKKKPFIFP